MGLMFIVIVGIVVRNLMGWLRVDHLIETGMQKRISGVCVDYLVTAAIAAIPLIVVMEHVGPIIIVGIGGGIATVLTSLWLSNRIWEDYNFERMIVCYGTLAGTISSGLDLCRVVDPEYSSPAVEGYLYGCLSCSCCSGRHLPFQLFGSVDWDEEFSE